MKEIKQMMASRVSNRARKFYGRVGAICNGYIQQGGIIQNEEGEILLQNGDVVNRWRTLFQCLLNPELILKCRQTSCSNAVKKKVMRGILPDVEDIEHFICKHENRAPGIDGLPGLPGMGCLSDGQVLVKNLITDNTDLGG